VVEANAIDYVFVVLPHLRTSALLVRSSSQAVMAIGLGLFWVVALSAQAGAQTTTPRYYTFSIVNFPGAVTYPAGINSVGQIVADICPAAERNCDRGQRFLLTGERA
jgi:hypothetical protein